MKLSTIAAGLSAVVLLPALCALARRLFTSAGLFRLTEASSVPSDRVYLWLLYAPLVVLVLDLASIPIPFRLGSALALVLVAVEALLLFGSASWEWRRVLMSSLFIALPTAGLALLAIALSRRSVPRWVPGAATASVTILAYPAGFMIGVWVGILLGVPVVLM
jgi:hypothetical protein